MSNGSDIAAEIRAGLIEAAESTGDGQLNFVLSKGGGLETPWAIAPDAPTLFDFVGVITKVTLKDSAGMVLKTVRVALLDATGEAEPVKGDLIAIGVVSAGVTVNTEWVRIEKVDVIRPGDVALMHKAQLDD